MNRAKISKLNTATKLHVSLFVNAATKARIDAMARVSGMSRGQIVDIAIEACREEFGPEPIGCWKQGCYLAVIDDEGTCEVHGKPEGES